MNFIKVQKLRKDVEEKKFQFDKYRSKRMQAKRALLDREYAEKQRLKEESSNGKVKVVGSAEVRELVRML